MKAVWNGAILAESNNTLVVESNHYFPPDSLNRAFLRPSQTTTHCSWKGEAHYLTVEVDGKTNEDAAWYYPEPKEAAKKIRGMVAFWHGVEIQE